MVNKSETEEKCRICNCSMTIRFEVKGFELYKCDKCGFEQILLRSDKDMVEYTEEYFASNKYNDTGALAKEHERRIRILRKYAEAGEKVLDYGCASGEFVDYAAEEYDMTGCDVSSAAIETAKIRFVDRSHCFKTLQELWNDDCSYRAVCLWDVIEHIDHPVELLEKLKDKIESNGFLIMSTPNIGALFARITGTKWPFMTPPEHLCFFTKTSMTILAERLNLDICDWKTHGKWANVGFILYKYNRVSKTKIPKGIVELFSKGMLSKLHIYVPTGDVQYVVFRKIEVD